MFPSGSDIKCIILQKHCPQLARLFEAEKSVQSEIKIKAN